MGEVNDLATKFAGRPEGCSMVLAFLSVSFFCVLIQAEVCSLNERGSILKDQSMETQKYKIQILPD